MSGLNTDKAVARSTLIQAKQAAVNYRRAARAYSVLQSAEPNTYTAEQKAEFQAALEEAKAAVALFEQQL